jgi:transposase
MEEGLMQVVHERCCGLDVHKRTVVACVLITGPDGAVARQVRTFKTMTADLLALADWLDDWQVTHVALESTGVYWRPVYNLLEDGRTLLLVNPQHMHAVPGRKTDVRDSEWLADLLRHGLLRASFIPPAPIRALRELTRYRKTLVQQRADEINRLHKTLEGANLKLASVASDVLGLSGRAMLAALVDGEQDPEALAQLARGTLRTKLPALRAALTGRVQAQHRVLIGQILAHADFLERAIAQVQAEIERRLPAYQDALALLQTIPGVRAVAAAAILAEIGPDVSRFPSAGHLASWAGLCPTNKQSAGKRLKGPINRGNVWLRAILAEVAWASIRTKASYFHAQFARIARRRGREKAAVAVAHSLLVVIYHLLKTGRPYTELGVDYFDRLDAARIERHHVRRLEQLGYAVTLTPIAA